MNQLLPRSELQHSLHEPSLSDQIYVGLAVTSKEKEKVYRLRYQIYVEEMGRRLSHVNHRRRLLYDDMDDWGLLFYARSGKEYVGTVRLHIGRKDEFPPELTMPMAMDKFHEFRSCDGASHPLSFASKGMIAPQFRKSRAHHLLCAHYYQACRNQGVLFHFSGGAPALVAMHEHLGARRYKSNFFVPDYGCMVPFVTLLDDIDHLRRVRSPFADVAGQWPNSQESITWFDREFPHARTRYVNKQLTDAAGLWRIIGERLGHPPEKAVGIFRGLSETEAKICASAGHLVYFDQADTVSYPDDMSDEIFIVVTGSLAARRQLASQRLTQAILRPGQVYGEKAFVARARQNATVVAQTNAELLILPRHALERLELQHPAVAAKLFHNIGARAARKYA
ncbi:cyclic nucleotide-binding domain-containing protein [Anaeroselena agilis]|uniref:Cyclic nucleotide-binding domain-containing protein n=1 Tax=Anaeroselena agilis TaxID=3063788 RepID=A0ABU3P1A8_9FIRM|nr:cyclic nucleotide-binding domain-containing protein [Selenomonadales bacterium 4137-cl]